MKKVIFSLLAILALGFVTDTAEAQTAQPLKVGIFDPGVIVQRLPEFKNVQAKVKEFQTDSLAPKRDELEFQYNRLDSTYKADSLAKKPQSVLDYSSKEKQKFYWQLLNWQSIVENATRQKYGQLAQPLYEKVDKAMQDIIKAQKITLVISPNEVIYFDDKTVINLFEPVAKTLGIDLNAQPQAPAGADSTGAGN